MPALAALALAVFAAALLGSLHAGRAATLHLMLAVGAMPLIFGAMMHFIPVLTRSRAAPTALAGVPLLALGGGLWVWAALTFPDTIPALVAGAVPAGAAAVALIVWSRRRRATMLGRPHPCLAWYEAALASLVLALLAVLATRLWPQQTVELRLFHVHLNTLGFIGLTAVSTLAVLMPTATGRPDPETGPRLRRDLPWAAAGTLLVALGAAWFAPLAWLGGCLWGVALVRLGARWWQMYRADIFALHGAAPLLAAALAGFAASLAFGAAGAAGWPSIPTSAFVAGFMLPLVTGAVSQLLPVWLHPGMQTPWHGQLRQRLGRYAGLRAVLFVIAGTAAGIGREWGLLLGAASLFWFLLQAGVALVQVGFIQERHRS